MRNQKSNAPSITLIVSCSIFPEQFAAFMASVEESTAVETVELVMVARQGCDYRSAVSDRFWSVRQVYIGTDESLNDARARATLLAQGDIIIYSEDHAHLRGPWVELLPELYADDAISAIGWTIQPGNIRTVASWSGFLVEYGWWGPGVTSAAALSHLPGHNCSYRRTRLVQLGADLSSYLLAEGILHWHFIKQGNKLFFTTEIQSIHYEPYTLRELWLADFWYGWNFASVRQKFGQWGYGRRLLFAAAIWLKPLIRWIEIAKTPREDAFFPKFILWRCALPITVTFFAATLGECLGHLRNHRRTAKKLETYELATNRRVDA